MPAYLDFVSVYGSQLDPRDLRFSGFHEQITLASDHSSQFEVPGLRRSGQQYQLCYNLKAVAALPQDPNYPDIKEWSIRQAAFHHQFDVKYGTATWISTKGGLKDLKTRVEELTGKEGRPEDKDYSSPAACFNSSLSVHLMYCSWSMEGWRSYIRWLEDTIERKVSI